MPDLRGAPIVIPNDGFSGTVQWTSPVSGASPHNPEGVQIKSVSRPPCSMIVGGRLRRWQTSEPRAVVLDLLVNGPLRVNGAERAELAEVLAPRLDIAPPPIVELRLDQPLENPETQAPRMLTGGITFRYGMARVRFEDPCAEISGSGERVVRDFAAEEAAGEEGETEEADEEPVGAD